MVKILPLSFLLFVIPLCAHSQGVQGNGGRSVTCEVRLSGDGYVHKGYVQGRANVHKSYVSFEKRGPSKDNVTITFSVQVPFVNVIGYNYQGTFYSIVDLSRMENMKGARGDLGFDVVVGGKYFSHPNNTAENGYGRKTIYSEDGPDMDLNTISITGLTFHSYSDLEVEASIDAYNEQQADDSGDGDSGDGGSDADDADDDNVADSEDNNYYQSDLNAEYVILKNRAEQLKYSGQQGTQEYTDIVTQIVETETALGIYSSNSYGGKAVSDQLAYSGAMLANSILEAATGSRMYLIAGYENSIMNDQFAGIGARIYWSDYFYGMIEFKANKDGIRGWEEVDDSEYGGWRRTKPKDWSQELSDPDYFSITQRRSDNYHARLYKYNEKISNIGLGVTLGFGISLYFDPFSIDLEGNFTTVTRSFDVEFPYTTGLKANFNVGRWGLGLSKRNGKTQLKSFRSIVIGSELNDNTLLNGPSSGAKTFSSTTKYIEVIEKYSAWEFSILYNISWDM